MARFDVNLRVDLRDRVGTIRRQVDTIVSVDARTESEARDLAFERWLYFTTNASPNMNVRIVHR